MVVQNLLVDVTAACDAAFPVQAADNLVTTEELLRAYWPALWLWCLKSFIKGATTALTAIQLQFGTEVQVLVVHQAFLLVPDDQDFIDDLFVSVELATNIILAKVNVDEILHACLDP